MRSSITGYIFGGFIISLTVIAIWQRNGVLDNQLFKKQTRELINMQEIQYQILPEVAQDSIENLLSWRNMLSLFSSLKYFSFFTLIIISSSFILMV